MSLWLVIVVLLTVTCVLIREHRLRRRADAKSRTLLSSSFTDLAILDPEGVIESCNDSWAQSRRTANPLTRARIGQSWLDGSEPASIDAQSDLAALRAALGAVLAGRQTEWALEYTWHDRGERQFSKLRLRGLDRRGAGAVVGHADVTATKRADARTRDALHELAHMNIRVAMGELVSSVTHELSQSLTASLGNAQALKRMLAAGAAEDLMPLADDIAAANRDAGEVIGRIRRIIRKEPFDLRPLDLNAVVMEVVHLLNSSAVNDGVLLVADLDPDLPATSADRVELRQVALNLVLNAVEATRGHPVGPAVVRVATAALSHRISMTVDDAGPGIAPDALSRLFEPYFTTKENGLGMGLSISRSIVESHGGSIDVTNLPHGGARFTVTLPRD